MNSQTSVSRATSTWSVALGRVLNRSFRVGSIFLLARGEGGADNTGTSFLYQHTDRYPFGFMDSTSGLGSPAELLSWKHSFIGTFGCGKCVEALTLRPHGLDCVRFGSIRLVCRIIQISRSSVVFRLSTGGGQPWLCTSGYFL